MRNKKAKNFYENDDSIKEHIEYNPDTGLLIWKTNRGHKIKAGDEIKTIDGNGYILVGFNKKRYKAHRVAWFITYGEWPKEIDHINGMRTDNRIANLRKITRKYNNINSKLRKSNVSGKTGVSKCPYNSKWVVRIPYKGKYLSIGRFDNLKDAIDARVKAELKYYGTRCRG